MNVMQNTCHVFAYDKIDADYNPVVWYEIGAVCV